MVTMTYHANVVINDNGGSDDDDDDNDEDDDAKGQLLELVGKKHSRLAANKLNVVTQRGKGGMNINILEI